MKPWAHGTFRFLGLRFDVGVNLLSFAIGIAFFANAVSLCLGPCGVFITVEARK